MKLLNYLYFLHHVMFYIKLSVKFYFTLLKTINATFCRVSIYFQRMTGTKVAIQEILLNTHRSSLP
jgi:hypothetical protein